MKIYLHILFLLFVISGSSMSASAQCTGLADWTYSVNGTQVNFFATDTSIGNIYTWSFGDGLHGIGADPTHQYQSGGTYTICLIVVNLGCHDTVCQNITLDSNACAGLANWTYQIIGSQVSFFASFPGNSSYIWSFGDGGSSLGDTTAHGYLQIGNYNTCLIINSFNLNCADTVCQNIDITNTNPCAGLADWTYVVYGDSVSFTSGDNNGNDSHVWTFGDGGTGLGINTGHLYPGYGIYTVCSIVSSLSASCSDTVCQNITVGTNPCLTLNADFTYTISGDTVHFFATDDSSNVKHQWTFGDGQSAGNFNTTHIYGSNGTYTVCHFDSIGGTGCLDSVCLSIIIGSNPCDSLSAAWTYTTSGDSVYVNALDLSGNIQFVWDFGDGTNGSGTSTNHLYDTSGTYTVCLYAYLIGTNCIDTLCQPISVIASNPCEGLSAAWTFNTSGDSIYVNATDLNSNILYIWTFGDGTNGSGANANHLYDTSGTYTVCLYAALTGTNCVDSFCQSKTVSTGPCNSLSANWTFTTSGDTIYVLASDLNNNITYSWTFGDGNSATGADANNVYDTSGTYTVCLYVALTGTNCLDTLCEPVNVTASNPCIGLNADWIFSTSGDSIYVNATDLSSNIQYLWNFGDGSNGSGPSSNHLYSSSGTYTVCLYVFLGGTNCTDTLCQSVTVSSGNPCDGLSAAWTFTTAGDSLYVNAIDLSDSIQYTWNFGDGTTGSGPSTNHLYDSSGTYVVCLYVYLTGTNCHDTLCQVVTVNNGNPCVGLSAAWTFTSSGDSLYASATDLSGNIQYVWHFGDGNNGSGANVNHLYDTSGSYTVCLYVYLGGTNCR